MIQSMTAVGRSSRSFENGRIEIEIQSVNKRFLDIQVTAPKDFFGLELLIKKWISKEVSRGQIQINLNLFLETAPYELVPNKALVSSIKEGWDRVCNSLFLAPHSIAYQEGLARLLTEESLLFLKKPLSSEMNLEEILKDVFQTALVQFLEMRTSEGAALKKDLEERLLTLKNVIKHLEKSSSKASIFQGEKLKGRLFNLMNEVEEAKERVYREVAILADRIDVTEEIVRVKSHLEQFGKYLLESSKGKTLEFLLQELQREFNTMASKVSDFEMTHSIIQAKGEIEKMKEQVQNIE